MSILLGPFEVGTTEYRAEEEEGDELLVFGYGCKLFRDDSKALLEDSGQLLIPWMGDTSLMIDRYVCSVRWSLTLGSVLVTWLKRNVWVR